MNVRRRTDAASGEVSVKFPNTKVPTRKGGPQTAKPIKNAVAMKPKAQGYKKIKGAVTG